MGYKTRDREVIPEDRRHGCYDLELLLETTSTYGGALDKCQGRAGEGQKDRMGSTYGGALCCWKESPVRVELVSIITVSSDSILVCRFISETILKWRQHVLRSLRQRMHLEQALCEAFVDQTSERRL